jgi:hypothetical protein
MAARLEMKQKNTNNDSDFIIHEIFKPLTKEVLEIVLDLRIFFKKEFPSLIEKGYPVWKGIGYTDSKSGYICAIFPSETEVKIGFEYGILLNDTNKVLTGDGKQIRYLPIPFDKKINYKLIQKFVKQSLALPRLKKDKLALIQRNF